MNNHNNFFDFTADAVGYINEVSIINTRKAKERFIALKVSILEGENAESHHFCDLIVRGQQALQVLEHLQQEWPQGNNGGPNWLAGLRIGSLYAKAYTSRKGEAKAVLGGRLLAIKWLKIGEERINVPEWRSDTPAVEQEQQTQRPQPQQPRQPQRQSQTPPQRSYQGQSQPQRQPQNPPQRGYQGHRQQYQQQPARSQNPQRSNRYQEQQQSQYQQQTA